MNIPDDFVFDCDLNKTDKATVSEIVSITTGRFTDSATYCGLILSADKPATILHIDHRFGNKYGQAHFEKGTKEFNELLELCYMKQVLG